MEMLTGKSVHSGIAIGRLSVYEKEDKKVKRVKIQDPEAEIKRFEAAKETAIQQLKGLYDKALKEVGEVNAMIFEVHQFMLEDLDYIESVTHIITSQKVNAEYAVASTGDNFSEMFAAMDDDYMKERAADVKDISNRVISILQTMESSETRSSDTAEAKVTEAKISADKAADATESGANTTEMNIADATESGDKSSAGMNQPSAGEPVIIVADDLAPSETVQLDKSKVLAFVTRHGSTNSHTAILARTMNIPGIIGIDYPAQCHGKLAIVDGYNGKFYIDPEEDILKEYKEKQEQDIRKKRLLQELKGKENITLDGRKINLYANIGGVSDVAGALQNDAGGIGLLRSEFLYLEKDTFPTEEEQFRAYKTVAENMAGRKVIIRTLDLGADKQVEYFHLGNEENPAMGYRAIRICLTQKDIFKTQLRAIFRASIYGTISIMYPMIISVKEVKEIKAMVEEVKAELKEQGISYGEVEQGIMIETPAAVMISDLLAKEVDFFSIGTNDLTQYTLAIDRQNPKLDAFYDSHHEAILRMIQMTVDNGHKEGCWVGICGELAADSTLTERFLDMGLDELSVSPSFILGLREKIRSIGKKD